MWQVKVFQPSTKFWGCYIAYNDKEIVIKQCVNHVESFYFKNSKVIFANLGERRKEAISKAKYWAIDKKKGLKFIGDSNFRNYCTHLQRLI